VEHFDMNGEKFTEEDIIAFTQRPTDRREKGEVRRNGEIEVAFKKIEGLGKGGMADVFLVRDKNDAYFALKELKNNEQLSLFKEEFELLKKLEHPNIIRVFDYFEDFFDEENHYFMLLENFPHCNLSEHMDSERKEEIFTPEAIEHILNQLFAAVEYAHGKGVYNRDLRPDNILFQEEEYKLKLIDPAISVADSDYLAPQLKGQPQEKPVATSDIYALGGILFFLTEKRMPTLKSKTPSRKNKLRDIISKCFEYNPADRYQSVSELRSAVDKVLGVKPGDKKTDNPGAELLRTGLERTFDGIEFVYIEPGEFDMGSNDGDSDEKPVHKVKISRGFWIGKYPVTQGQWQAVMGEGSNPSYFKSGDNYPVENVSWDDHKEHGVQTFIKKLNKKVCGKEFDSEQVWKENLKEGNREADGCYRLPTEAEWEYACRAGTSTEYSWGDDDSEAVIKKYAWYEKNAEAGCWTEPHADEEGTQPVGKKLPNPWGLYDMHGNVWEWVLDWHDDSYYEKCGSFCTDPANLTEGSPRVNRGGGWFNIAVFLRSALRDWDEPGERFSFLGFRLVCPVRR
jgi:formylglycine-generating enzyme required for sulfatase activity